MPLEKAAVGEGSFIPGAAAANEAAPLLPLLRGTTPAAGRGRPTIQLLWQLPETAGSGLSRRCAAPASVPSPTSRHVRFASCSTCSPHASQHGRPRKPPQRFDDTRLPAALQELSQGFTVMQRMILAACRTPHAALGPWPPIICITSPRPRSSLTLTERSACLPAVYNGRLPVTMPRS